MTEQAIGIIGGTGLYALDGLKNVREVTVKTPYGPPSSKLLTGKLHGQKVVFLARHGRYHNLLPSEVNYRANIYALKKMGAAWCIAVSAVGSLREGIAPGDVVVPDQIIDRTKQREASFFGDGIVAHVAFGEPFCPVLRETLIQAGRTVSSELLNAGNGEGVHHFRIFNRGTYVCMEGPAFSTRAESHMYRSLGGSVIGMTSVPECKLAREAELAYATLAFITDYDCWKDDEEHVDAARVMAVLRENADKARRIVQEALRLLDGRKPSELAANALKNALLTPLDKIPGQARKRLDAIIGRYL